MKLPENILWALWEHSELKEEIQHSDAAIKIVNRGKYTGNVGGPDYSEVTIISNGTRFTGSLEIDAERSGWVNHGHCNDPAFNSCILHIYGGEPNRAKVVTLSNGKALLSIPFFEILQDDLHAALAELMQKSKLPSSSSLICSGKLSELSSEEIKKYLYELAIQRFQKKCKRFSDLYYNCGQNIKLLYSLEPDAEFIWKYTISSMIFRAMGYSANTSLMEDLFSLVNPAFLIDYSPKENFKEYLEAYVWEISGLLPALSEIEEDDTIGYVRKLKERWEEVRKYLNASRISKFQWKMRGLRPNATVYLRLFSAVQIVAGLWKNGFSEIFHKKSNSLSQKDFNKLLIGYLQVQPGDFWSKHSSFTNLLSSPLIALPGESRVQEILINVVLPGLYSYYTLTGNGLMKELCKTAFIEMKLRNNPGSISKMLKELLPLEKSDMAVYYQGAVELQNEYCKQGKCDECRIGQKIF